jgi:DNA end-binding protein Ku
MRNLVLRLGEISIPVGLVATASEPDEKLFRTLHAGECKAPIALRVYCPADQRVLEPDETVKAWEVAPGQFLELDTGELEALTPTDSSVVPLGYFVPADDLDPLLVKKRYHLAPAKAFVGRGAYRALAAAMHDEKVVAVARFNAWNSEQLGAISTRGGVLELATLHFVDDVALEQSDEIAEQLAEQPLAANAAALMRDVVARYTRTLKPGDLASLHRPRVRELLEAKLAGQPIVEPAAESSEAEPLPAVPADLETALRRTLKAAPRRRRVAARA